MPKIFENGLHTSENWQEAKQTAGNWMTYLVFLPLRLSVSDCGSNFALATAQKIQGLAETSPFVTKPPQPVIRPLLSVARPLLPIAQTPLLHDRRLQHERHSHDLCCPLRNLRYRQKHHSSMRHAGHPRKSINPHRPINQCPRHAGAVVSSVPVDWDGANVALQPAMQKDGLSYPRTSAPVAAHTFFTSLAWAFSTSSLVSVRSAARYASAYAMDFLPSPTRTGSR